MGVSARGNDFGAHLDAHVRLRDELLDQITGHAFLQRIAPDDKRDRAGVIGEVERRLTGRVSAAYEVDVESMGRARFAARRTVVNAFADEPIEAVDGEPPPSDASGKDERSGSDGVVAIEIHLTCLRIDS